MAIRRETVPEAGGRRSGTRIVAATNRYLTTFVEHGLFRADLFYRLSGVEVHVPPLRRRKEDILELARYFLSRCGGRQKFGITPAAVDALITYEWPGNVRELERMIEGGIATAESHRSGSTICR